MGIYSHPVSHGEAGCCHSANPLSGLVARCPRSPPIGNPLSGVRTKGPAAKRGSSQGDRASGPPVPPSIGAGWRETDHVPIGGPEKAEFWLGTEHMRTSGPAPWSALLRRAPSTPVASPQSATFRLKAGRNSGSRRGGPAPCPLRRVPIPDPAPSEGRPSASKCAYSGIATPFWANSRGTIQPLETRPGSCSRASNASSRCCTTAHTS